MRRGGSSTSHHPNARRAKLTVVDATNVQPHARKSLLAIAREHDCMAVAIVLDLPAKLCHERNQGRADRQFGFHVVRQHVSQLRQSLRELRREGFRYVTVLDSLDAIEQVAIERTRLWTNRRDDHGPFDIIGDVHGCFDELVDLLRTLGYTVDPDQPIATPPDDRKAVFLGDLVDLQGHAVRDLETFARAAFRMTPSPFALISPRRERSVLARIPWSLVAKLSGPTCPAAGQQLAARSCQR